MDKKEWKKAFFNYDIELINENRKLIPFECWMAACEYMHKRQMMKEGVDELTKISQETGLGWGD